MTNTIDRAMAGSGAAALTKEQRRRMVARYIVPAWKHQRSLGLAGEDMEAWRREEQWKACRKEYLRAATQADWAPLCAHFLRLAGNVAAGNRQDLRGRCQGIHVALWHLRQAMDHARGTIERPEEYCAAIAKARFKTRDVKSLSERQVWGLVFDMRRAAQRRRKVNHGSHGLRG